MVTAPTPASVPVTPEGLVPVAQAMVDATAQIAEACLLVGDFSITLTVTRKAGVVASENVDMNTGG